MKKYIAILRGINVSGKNKVPMAELRQLLSDKGLDNLQTYIQSGNLVFQSNLKEKTIPDLIREAIKVHFGFEVPTLLLTANELRKTVEQNPYLDQDISKVHVTFLASAPDDQLIDSLPASSNPNEDFLVKGRTIYVYCPDGYGRTKINNTFFEKKLGITATTRNWKTCMKLFEMVSSP